MRVIPKQKPLKKRAQYRKTALLIRGTGNAAFFESKADLEDFRRVVRDLGFSVESRKNRGWWAWVK